MKNARTVLSTYSSDTFGVCSALYELGGMTVMHDASGCNSTYSTHDEPRWYHSQSLVFISGLTETDAILGNDRKFINDVVKAIDELSPSFAAIAGTPIPWMSGFDIRAAAAAIEEKAGIPCLGFDTNGMNSYVFGAGEALASIAERFTEPCINKRPRGVNILGATPLDFSLSGTVPSIRKLLSDNGWDVVSCFAMGDSLRELKRAGEASADLVISGAGMKAAKALYDKYGIPYVVGTPVGAFSGEVLRTLEKTLNDGENRMAFSGFIPEKSDAVIIGESVISRSVAAAFKMECGIMPRVINSVDEPEELFGVLSPGDLTLSGEEEVEEACREAALVAADPLYKAVIPQNARLIPMPHVAFSGRIYRDSVPDLTEFYPGRCAIL